MYKRHVVVRTELAVQVMPAQFELHTLAKFIQKRVLRFGGKFGKHTDTEAITMEALQNSTVLLMEVAQ